MVKIFNLIVENVWKSHNKVSFNIASEASYDYILCKQKIIKNARNGQLSEFMKTEAYG